MRVVEDINEMPRKLFVSLSSSNMEGLLLPPPSSLLAS
jgi:hypothetical protein